MLTNSKYNCTIHHTLHNKAYPTRKYNVFNHANLVQEAPLPPLMENPPRITLAVSARNLFLKMWNTKKASRLYIQRNVV